MTVEELKKVLSQYPDDIEVFVLRTSRQIACENPIVKPYLGGIVIQ